MKTTKFLFVMAMAAGLAACTKELVEPGKPVDSVIEEVKGAKVIANGFSINPNASDIQTKISVDENNLPHWTPGDLAGVAWFVHDGVDATQSAEKNQDLDAVVYANHKLICVAQDAFESNSNVFEGWHLAYHPYNVMTRPSKLTNITVNPTLTDDLTVENQFRKDRYNNCPMISGLYYFGLEDVKDAKVDTQMPMQYVANNFLINLYPDAKLGEMIRDLQVESIQFTSKKSLFLTSLSVEPKHIPLGDEEKAPEFKAEYFGEGKAFYGSYETTSETEIAKENQENYTLGDGLMIRMFVAPINPAEVNDLSASDLTLRVNLVDGSYFTFKAPKDKNSRNYKDGFDKFVKFLQKGEITENHVGLHFDLTPDAYKTTYTVSKEGDPLKNMNNTLEFARQAGAESIALKFDAGVEIPYEGIELPEGMIVKCSSSKSGATFVINETVTWNENIVLGNYMNIKVEATGNLTIANKEELTAFKVVSLTNNGILNVGKNVNITATNFVSEGDINVSEGSKFDISDQKDLDNVVYTVVETEATSVIDDLITNTDLMTLNVNGVWTPSTAGTANWGTLTVNMTNAEFNAGSIDITVGTLALSGNNKITCGTLDVLAEDYVLVAPAGYTTEINATVNDPVVANGVLTVGAIKSTLEVAKGVEVVCGNVTGLAVIGEGAEVETTGFAAGVQIAANANVTVKGTAKAAISKSLTIAEGANVTVTGPISVSKTAIIVPNEAKLNVNGKITAGSLTIAEGAGEVTIKGDVAAALTIEKGETITIDGNVTGAVEVAEGANLTVNGSISSTKSVVKVAEGASLTVTSIKGNVEVAEGATLKVNGVNGNLNVGKDADVAVTGNITGDVDVAEGATFEVKGNIVAGKINVAAKNFKVDGNIEINAAAVGAPEITISKDTEFTLTGDITVPEGSTVEVDLAVYGKATLIRTNMPKNSNLYVYGEVTIYTYYMEDPRITLGNIFNKGTLKVVGPKYVYVENLNMEGSTSTTVESPGILYYYGEVTLGGKTSGTIKSAKRPADGAGYEVIGEKYYVNRENGLANAIQDATETTINVVLETNVKLDAADYGAKTIFIDGGKDKKQITFNKPTADMDPISAKSIEITNATIVTANTGVGYQRHALVFDCPVIMNGVVTESTIFVRGEYESTFNNVEFLDSYDSYSLWLDPNGQTVNVTGCTFNCARGIKVDDRDMEKFSSPYDVKATKLNVSGTTFITKKKAAVGVHSAQAVNITWSNNNIENVTAAPEVPVWIDEEVKKYDYAKANTYIQNVIVNDKQYGNTDLIAIEGME